MNKSSKFAVTICAGTILASSIGVHAGTCIPTPVPVQVEGSKKETVFEGKPYLLDVETYTAETPTFIAKWVEEGDPAYELVIFNKLTHASCKIVNDQPFISFDDRVVYQAKNGRVVIMEEGIGSWFQASFYDVATCKRIAHIDDLYPNNAYRKYFFGSDSVMTLGDKTTYELGDDCVPRKIK